MLVFAGLLLGLALVAVAVWAIVMIWSTIIWPVVELVAETVGVLGVGLMYLFDQWQERRGRVSEASAQPVVTPGTVSLIDMMQAMEAASRRLQRPRRRVRRRLQG